MHMSSNVINSTNSSSRGSRGRRKTSKNSLAPVKEFIEKESGIPEMNSDERTKKLKVLITPITSKNVNVENTSMSRLEAIRKNLESEWSTPSTSQTGYDSNIENKDLYINNFEEKTRKSKRYVLYKFCFVFLTVENGAKTV